MPLSTLIEVLDEYDNDPSFDPDCVYDKHLLAAYIICQGFEKMKKERLPQAAQLLAATVVLQSWCSQDLGRWTTTYFDGTSYVTELMNSDKTLEVFGQDPTMGESIIKAAEQIKL